jgi:hypothetical protein
VYPPQDVTFSMSGASVQFTVEDPASGEPFAATFPDLNLFGDTLAITLADYNSSDYMMISEIEIFGDPNFAPCPADVNNDGMVDVLDLLAVLAAWGAAGGPEDINGDGIVDVLDLLALLGAWGPCAGGPPSGACCFYPSGDCYEMLEAYCIAAGGDWQGGGTDCATTVCPSAATGETIGDALPIPALPYSTDGDTSTFADDYDEVCPYANSTSSDVVYAYTPLGNQTVDITLCSDSGYDTKLYVYEDNYTPGSPFACNDDSCTTPGGQQFVSELLGLSFISGNTYFIVVDGYAGQNGYYTLDVN